MELRDMIAVGALFISLFLGPVTAVCITLWSQHRRAKRELKVQLFVTLMSNRAAIHLSPEAVMAINLIDVVFADHPRVVTLWHQLYGALHTKPLPAQEIGHLYVEMLSAMAEILGFRQLQQVNIAKYYTPQAREDQLQLQTEIQSELLRVLKNTVAVMSEKRPV